MRQKPMPATHPWKLRVDLRAKRRAGKLAYQKRWNQAHKLNECVSLKDQIE